MTLKFLSPYLYLRLQAWCSMPSLLLGKELTQSSVHAGYHPAYNTGYRESLSIQKPFPFLACLGTPGQMLLICSPLYNSGTTELFSVREPPTPPVMGLFPSTLRFCASVNLAELISISKGGFAVPDPGVCLFPCCMRSLL